MDIDINETVKELEEKIEEIAALGYPTLAAVSNKDFIGESIDRPQGEYQSSRRIERAVPFSPDPHLLRKKRRRQPFKRRQRLACGNCSCSVRRLKEPASSEAAG